MTTVLLDTHTWAWALKRDGRLSRKAAGFIDQADAVFIRPITFFEISQKVRIGKWPEMQPIADRLLDILTEQGGKATVLSPEICLLAGQFDWPHRDPFDRMLAATAIHYAMPFISADSVFDQLAGHDGWIARLW